MVRLNLQLFGAWETIRKNTSKINPKSNEEIAKEVMQGKWGSGADRKTKLTNAGYDYSAVQNIVNTELKGGNKTASPTTTGLATSNVATTPTKYASNNVASTPASTQITGVSQSSLDNYMEEFKTKDSTNKKEELANTYADAFYEKANQENIVDQKYWDTINKESVVPEAITQADAWLAEQREKIQSGKTSYTDQLNDLMNKYMNREEFEYDVDNDPLFQQALASAMNSGKSAMQDTIGQASALTGGYGSTYATSVGNQTYNAFIEDAYNNLPQYYQMALEAYQMEGQDMLNQLGLLNDADAKEYERMFNSYDINWQNRNQMYNEWYNSERDAKNDAFAAANLQLNQYGTELDAAYNAAALSNDQWQQSYQNDFNEWSAEISKWGNIVGLENSDYWAQTNFDESVRQADRAYEQTERWNQKNYDLDKAKVDNDNRVAELEAENKALEEKYAGYISPEIQKAESSEATKSFNSSILTESEFNRRGASITEDGKQKRFDNYNQYIYATMDKWLKDGKLTKNEATYLYWAYGLTDDDAT